jgi:long-subunit fatty acid transport protein
MKKIALIVLVILLAASTGFGQFAKVGTAGMKFLDISVATRGVGMGNVFSAFADDASTLFWNPAGMENIATGEAWAGMVSWPADIYLHAASAVLKASDIGHFGVSFRFLDVGLMTETDVFNPQGNGGTFGVASWAAGVSYSRSLTERFALGITFNYIQEQLASWTENTWAFDLGGFYNTGFQGITLGFSIMNFGPAMRFEVDDDRDGKVDEDILDGEDNDGDLLVDEDVEQADVPTPINFKFGIKYPAITAGDSRLDLGAEILHPADNTESYNLGAEYVFMNMLAVRGGYAINEIEGSGISAGAGFNLNISGDMAIFIDYAFSDMGVLTSAHRASIGFSF